MNRDKIWTLIDGSGKDKFKIKYNINYKRSVSMATRACLH